MPLITPKMPPRNTSDPLYAIMRELDGCTQDQIVGDGLILSHLNFGNELRRVNKINEYPPFRRNEHLEMLHAKGLQERPGNRHDTERLSAYLRVPATDCHVKDEWRRVWEQEFEYDTPEERSRKIRENPEFYGFENYEPELNSYGVCDSPEQLVAMYDFASDPRKFCIVFTAIVKANQSPDGGWRWHKWGPYIGTHKPQYEYLYDEKDIEQVYVFHIYELLDIEEGLNLGDIAFTFGG